MTPGFGEPRHGNESKISSFTQAKAVSIAGIEVLARATGSQEQREVHLRLDVRERERGLEEGHPEIRKIES
jgi:hypothetical protein